MGNILLYKLLENTFSYQLSEFTNLFPQQTPQMSFSHGQIYQQIRFSSLNDSVEYRQRVNDGG